MDRVEARPLGQILLIESLVAQLPNKTAMLRFAARGLAGFPGSGRVWFQDEPLEAEGVRSFQIHHHGHPHAVLCFQVADEGMFSHYIPYLHNFAFMLGLVLDERIQREENEQYRTRLESLVEARTRALVESERQARTMLRTALDGVWLVDAEGRLVEVNDAACTMLGYRHDELVGMAVAAIDGTGFRERIRDNVFEARHRRKDGTLIQVEVSVTFHSEARQTLVFIRDITERKRVEEENARLQDQLRQVQKMESLGTLSGGIAHDMNNVLGAILGLASAHLEREPPGTQVHQSFETIVKAATRGGEMVGRLLAFARQGRAEERQVDVNALIQEEVRLLERTTLAKVRLEMDLDPGLHPLRGDPGALAHALMNLCVNAVDAMPEQGLLVLRTRNVGEAAIDVTVEDTGSGMPPEVLARAMDPFFTTKGMGHGTGLGLSLVYSTVKAHQGELEIRSLPGQGTQVRMRFPAWAGGREAAPPAEARPEAGFALQVLLVDDDDLIRSAVETLLGALGHAVRSAAGGREALEAVAAGLDPDLVILDMNMPGMGGAAALEGLRALLPEVPVLLATGRADQAVLELTRSHPGVTLLPKPFTLQELEAAVRASRLPRPPGAPALPAQEIIRGGGRLAREFPVMEGAQLPGHDH